MAQNKNKYIKYTLSNGSTIDVLIWRNKAKTSSIRCKRDGSIKLSLTRYADLSSANKLLAQYDEWIIKSIKTMEKRMQVKQAEAVAINNSKFKICGKEWDVILKQSATNDIRFTEKAIEVSVPDTTDTQYIDKLVMDFRTKIALNLYKQLANKYLAECGIILSSPLTISIKKVNSYWGKCCYTKNKIILSDRLIFAPMPCIEFLILHEIAHFKEHNHQQGFHKLMATHMPDYKARNKLLLATFR